MMEEYKWPLPEGFREPCTLRQLQVADRLGISQSYISRLEKRIILRLRREIVKMS